MGAKMRSPVSDHALLRWIERIQGINLDPTRMEIASICAEALAVGATSLVTDHGTFVLECGKVVTILEPGQRPGRSKTFERLRLRQAYKEAAE
jgi:hypothetical protein